MRNAIPVMLIVVVALGVALLAPGASAAKTGREVQEADISELERIAGDLEDVVENLQRETALNAEELNALRRELTVIYRDVAALQARLAQADADDGGASSQIWQLYTDGRLEVSPYGAQFNGWNKAADTSFKFGNYGEIIVTINNIDYLATWKIKNAYTGKVEARLNPQRNGDVVLTVKDEDGQHEFLMQDGGLGALMLRGRAGYTAPVTKKAT